MTDKLTKSSNKIYIYNLYMGAKLGGRGCTPFEFWRGGSDPMILKKKILIAHIGPILIT